MSRLFTREKMRLDGSFAFQVSIQQCSSPFKGYQTTTNDPAHSISGTLVSIGKDLGDHLLSVREKEIITSATTAGALVGGLAAGMVSDYAGRKWVIAFANVVFIGGYVELFLERRVMRVADVRRRFLDRAFVQVAARSLGVMVLGRLIVGLGASPYAPFTFGAHRSHSQESA